MSSLVSYERPPQRIRSETDRFGGPRGVNRAVLSIVLRAMLGIDADHRFDTAAPVGGNRSPANSEAPVHRRRGAQGRGVLPVVVLCERRQQQLEWQYILERKRKSQREPYGSER